MSEETVRSIIATATHRQFVCGVLARCQAACALTTAVWKESRAERSLDRLVKLVETVESGANRTGALAQSVELLAPGSALATAARTEAESANHCSLDARLLFKRRCEHLGVGHA